ncbi:branched-chain amino acid transaminase [Aureimonas altamirensis]|uniref:branched-chain amino acid transaminase n=1 Tax=Aureimonas altamirensis TaxID=370622 RepID=UPI00255594F6|nr:branched-chain amino acid transaminase [Aureimonas altamirensis]
MDSILTMSTYPSDHPEYAWLDGQFVKWEDCRVHVRTQGGFFGANVFEGLRAYWNADHEELYVFRLAEHLRRLEQSMKIMRMTPPYTSEELKSAVIGLFARTGLRQHAQANLVVYFGFPQPGDPLASTTPTGAHITAVPMGRSPMTDKGIRAGVSGWRRLSDDTMPIRIKIGSNYQNSRLAQNEVVASGYDMALLLNSKGKVSEAPGACIFALRDGKLITPPTCADILESITRLCVLEIARVMGVEVVERDLDRSELYLSDEVFICGSIAEIIPVCSIDGITVGDGSPGATTRAIQRAYFDAVECRTNSFTHWCEPVFSQKSQLIPTGG